MPVNTDPWNILPEEFLNRLERIIPQRNLKTVLEAFCIKQPTSFRANTLKITAPELEKKLVSLGFNIQRVIWYKDAFILVDQPQKILTETDLYKNGFFYVQSLSSMIPPLVLDPRENEMICDITAAPGSKTTQMSALMKNTGKIVANDRSRVRSYKLQANLTSQGVRNAKVTYLAGQVLWKSYPESFDKTLVDVPCSMEGRFLCSYPKSYQNWTQKKVKELGEIQKWILRSAVSATKPGGIIVYSTCTLSPEENEGVIDWILKKEKNVVEVEKIRLDISNSMQGMEEWNDKKFDPRVNRTLRILPSSLMEGFYVAKLRKVKSNV